MKRFLLKDEHLYLHHMRERCVRVGKYIESGRKAFFEQEQTQDAVIRNLEVIGEAAKHVGAELRKRLPGVDWRAICGMRDVLIHGYIAVDLEEVWNVATNYLPELHSVLDKFLSAETLSGASSPSNS